MIEISKNINESYSAKRLYNDALAAYLAAFSAKERKESIGCHIRSDGVTVNEHYRIILKKDNGQILAQKEMIRGGKG